MFCIYELTNYPLSPFKDRMMSGSKASLSNFVTKVPTEIVQVTDGGALLYQVKWSLYTMFSDIYKLY